MIAALHLGSCLDPVAGLASLADDSIDIIATDPPYNEHVDANSLRGRGRRPGGVKKDLGFAPIGVGEMEVLADQFVRVCKRWVLVFCAEEQAHDWRGALTSAGLEYVRCGIWLKDGATPQFTGDRPGQAFEAIVIAHRPGKKRWNGGGKLGVWRSSTAYREQDAMIHTTQKPESLMRALLADFSEPGEVVLDPFMGSGTTGAAARSMGRGFVGWEINDRYFGAAQSRIESTREQLELVRHRVPKMKQGALL